MASQTYWTGRMLAELFIVICVLVGMTRLERADVVNFGELGDFFRIHLLYALLVFWLARWHPRTIRWTGTIYVLGLAFSVFIGLAVFYLPSPWILALSLLIFAAYRLGKSQYRETTS
jgi:hypothetical protein